MAEKVYGIDLGTTNSLIGRGDILYSGLVPSTVNLLTGEVGENQKENFKEGVVRSFKRDMSMGLEGKTPIVASAKVLSELVKRVPEEVKNIIITVPAYFTENNRQATKQAAVLANLNVIRIINEPTAAAINYSKNFKARTLVYDLGGGTFDISLIDSRMGKYDVVTTDGNKIGGDDLDYAIREALLGKAGIPVHRLKDEDIHKLKSMCEKAKHFICNNRADYTFDLKDLAYTDCDKNCTLTVEEYNIIMKNVFASTIKKTNRIIQQYLPDDSVYTFLLVGGSTRDPFLREWIIEETHKEPVELTYDPDKIVAEGAAYCAELAEKGKLDELILDIISSPIGIGLLNGTIKTMIPKNSKLPFSESKPFTNTNEVEALVVAVYQGDSRLVDNADYLGELKYEYGKIMPPHKGIINVTLTVNIDGLIEVKARQGRRKEETLLLDRKAYTERSNVDA